MALAPAHVRSIPFGTDRWWIACDQAYKAAMLKGAADALAEERRQKQVQAIVDSVRAKMAPQ